MYEVLSNRAEGNDIELTLISSFRPATDLNISPNKVAAEIVPLCSELLEMIHGLLMPNVKRLPLRGGVCAIAVERNKERHETPSIRV